MKESRRKSREMLSNRTARRADFPTWKLKFFRKDLRMRAVRTDHKSKNIYQTSYLWASKIDRPIGLSLTLEITSSNFSIHNYAMICRSSSMKWWILPFVQVRIVYRRFLLCHYVPELVPWRIIPLFLRLIFDIDHSIDRLILIEKISKDDDHLSPCINTEQPTVHSSHWQCMLTQRKLVELKKQHVCFSSIWWCNFRLT